MASPATEMSAIGYFLTSIGLTFLLGFDPIFWWAIGAFTAMKMLNPRKLTPIDPQTNKAFAGRRLIRLHFVNFLGAIIPPIAFTKGFAYLAGISNLSVEIIIAVALVIGGHGITEWWQKKAENPDSIFEKLLDRYLPPSRGGGYVSPPEADNTIYDSGEGDDQ